MLQLQRFGRKGDTGPAAYRHMRVIRRDSPELLGPTTQIHWPRFEGCDTSPLPINLLRLLQMQKPARHNNNCTVIVLIAWLCRAGLDLLQTRDL